MADLYGTIASSSSSSPPPPSSSARAPESDEISLILHQLLTNSNSSYPSYTTCGSHAIKHANSTAADTSSAAGFLRVGDGRSSGGGFSYPGFDCATDERAKAFSSLNGGSCEAIVSSGKRRRFSLENDGEDFGCDSEGNEASELPLDPVPSRSSSKRTRAAEVHNLSEKRRRSKINEKMRELQKLIPNSNKTDKASMLDEAIEYLKQLQLQVQMLSMRNGLALHPVYLPGVLQPMQVPQTGPCFDDEGTGRLNVNRGTNTFLVNQQETTPQAAFGILEECNLPNQRIVVPTNTSIANSGTPFGLEPSMQAHYAPFSLSTPSKEMCREDTKPQLQLEITHSGKNITPGVSS